MTEEEKNNICKFFIIGLVIGSLAGFLLIRAVFQAGLACC